MALQDGNKRAVPPELCRVADDAITGEFATLQPRIPSLRDNLTRLPLFAVRHMAPGQRAVDKEVNGEVCHLVY